jgi:hypothetical protein
VRWDLALSIALLVVNLLAGITMAVVAVLLVVTYDTCAVNVCNYGGFTLGWFTAMLAPPLALTIAMVVTFVRLRRRRRAFWVPLVGIGVAVLLFFAGAQVVFWAVPGTSF